MPLSPQEEKMQQALRGIWKTSRATLEERMIVLNHARKALSGGTLDAETRQRAESAAHKLAGVLGTFGLMEGSALASKLEQAFSSAGEPAGMQPMIQEWLYALAQQIAAHDRRVNEAQP